MGRLKKKGERYPGGKLKPTGEPITGAHWQRLRDIGPRLLNDPKLASEVGRLVFYRELTPQQAGAADRIGIIYGAFERQHQIKRRTRSPTYELGFSGDASANDALMSPEQRANADARMMAIDTAFKALADILVCYPRDLRNMLETLCVDDGALPTAWLPLIRGALDEVAKELGISTSRKKGRVRKAKKFAPPAAASSEPAPAAPAAKPPSIDKLAYLAMLKTMRPDLDGAGREKAWAMYLAMKDREAFARSKTAKEKA